MSPIFWCERRDNAGRSWQTLPRFAHYMALSEYLSLTLGSIVPPTQAQSMPRNFPSRSTEPKRPANAPLKLAVFVDLSRFGSDHGTHLCGLSLVGQGALPAKVDLSRFSSSPLRAYSAAKKTNYGTNTDGRIS
jgi:hypothetical protein